MARKYLLPATLVIGIVVVCTAAGLYVHSRLFFLFGTDPPQVSTVCPVDSEAAPPGGPGITPRNDCTPSFTAQDVRDYIASFHGLNKVGIVGQPTITHIWFITSDDAGYLTAEAASNFGVPVVCYVSLTGTFTVDAPPIAGGSTAGTTGSGGQQRQHGAIVFNAHTGNILEMGAGP